MGNPLPPDQKVVTAAQMRAIENRLFAAGMPVAALMEKVAGRIAAWFGAQYPRDRFPRVGVLVGAGHNGGDALVAARELHHQGYGVLLWCPLVAMKALTASHHAYLGHLGVIAVEDIGALQGCDVLLDGLFGFGLTRPVTGSLGAAIATLNTWDIPVVSIDLPSGLETDTGQVLGVAVQATHTLCLGLWKRGLLQDAALPWMGQPILIPFDIPLADIQVGWGDAPLSQRLTAAAAIAHLPLPRAPTAHKYTAGHLLLVTGSAQYAGAALLAGQGAIASGVGMVTLVVPESLRRMVVSRLPEALVMGAPESPTGAIATLPTALDWAKYDVIAVGSGMTPDIDGVMTPLLACDRPLVIDADALNWLAQRDPVATLKARSTPALLTPHLGEFRRLFPDFLAQAPDPVAAAQQAAQATHGTLILKGAISAIAQADGQLWYNPDSTPALARGGSGDVLTGLVAGLAAQGVKISAGDGDQALKSAAIAAVWWHAQTAREIAQAQTTLGCSPSTLAARLPATLATLLQASVRGVRVDECEGGWV